MCYLLESTFSHILKLYKHHINVFLCKYSNNSKWVLGVGIKSEMETLALYPIVFFNSETVAINSLVNILNFWYLLNRERIITLKLIVLHKCQTQF